MSIADCTISNLSNTTDLSTEEKGGRINTTINNIKEGTSTVTNTITNTAASAASTIKEGASTMHTTITNTTAKLADTNLRSAGHTVGDTVTDTTKNTANVFSSAHKAHTIAFDGYKAVFGGVYTELREEFKSQAEINKAERTNLRAAANLRFQEEKAARKALKASNKANKA